MEDSRSILQLRAGAAIRRTNQEVLHVVELLDRALAYRHMECGGPPPL